MCTLYSVYILLYPEHRRPVRHCYFDAFERRPVPARIRRRLALHLLRVRRRWHRMVRGVSTHDLRGPGEPPSHSRGREEVHPERLVGQRRRLCESSLLNVTMTNQNLSSRLTLPVRFASPHRCRGSRSSRRCRSGPSS